MNPLFWSTYVLPLAEYVTVPAPNLEASVRKLSADLSAHINGSER